MERNGVYGAFFCAVYCCACNLLPFRSHLLQRFHPHTHIFGRGCPTFTLLGPWPNLNSISERWWPTGARRPGWKKSSHFSQLAVKQTSLQWEFEKKKFSSKHFYSEFGETKMALSLTEKHWESIPRFYWMKHMLQSQFTINLKCQYGPDLKKIFKWLGLWPM